MQRSFLIFAIAFIALMAGALFYAARIPVEVAQPVDTTPPAEIAADSTGFVPVYPEFSLPDTDGVEHALEVEDAFSQHAELPVPALDYT